MTERQRDWLWVLGGVVCGIAIVAIAVATAPDITDEQRARLRALNGATIHIDPDTGCQYLSRYKSGMTPRLRADGSQVCK